MKLLYFCILFSLAFQDSMSTLAENIYNELKDFSAAKRDFLKQMMILTLNAIEQTEGINSRNIVIPIELRNNLKIAIKDPVEIYSDVNTIVLKKHHQ